MEKLIISCSNCGRSYTISLPPDSGIETQAAIGLCDECRERGKAKAPPVKARPVPPDLRRRQAA